MHAYKLSLVVLFRRITNSITKMCMNNMNQSSLYKIRIIKVDDIQWHDMNEQEHHPIPREHWACHLSRNCRSKMDSKCCNCCIFHWITRTIVAWGFGDVGDSLLFCLVFSFPVYLYNKCVWCLNIMFFLFQCPYQMQMH